MDKLKMDLKKEVVKYINHKVVLSKVTDWYSYKPQQIYLSDCFDFRQLLQFHSDGIGSKQLAKMILANEIKLKGILPNPNNKTYKNQVQKIDSIINYCNDLFK